MIKRPGLREQQNKVTPKIEVDLLRESLVNRLAIVAKANDNKIQNRQVMDAIEEKISIWMRPMPFSIHSRKWESK